MIAAADIPDLDHDIWRSLNFDGQDHAWSRFVAILSTIPPGVRWVYAIDSWDGGNPNTARRRRDAAAVRSHVAVWRSVACPLPAPLPPALTVYHGARASVDRVQVLHSMSWTLDPVVARSFALVHGRGTVWSAEVEGRFVLCAHDTRGEAEVIIDPAGLSSVQAWDPAIWTD
jgi:hypothetical protein